MRFSGLTARIEEEGAHVWDVHYQGLARRLAGEDIIMLSIGEEIHAPTAPAIVAAAVASLNAGQHHYSPIAGTPELRQAIAQHHYALSGQVVADTQCAVFAGAQNALFAVAQCLLEPGDEIILIEPYYTIYPATVSASGAKVVTVATTPDQQFQLNPEAVIAAMTPNTRAVLLNSPNNPTGAVYTEAQLRPLVAACAKRGIWLLSDEVYQALIPPAARVSAAALPGGETVGVTISSVSKSHRMTGWRLGWVVGPPTLLHHLYNLALCMNYGLPEFVMAGAVTALRTQTATMATLRAQFDRRRIVVEQRLRAVPRLRVHTAPGGMFVMVDLRALSLPAYEFTRQLLAKHRVAVLACDGFGASGAGMLRLSLCEPRPRLKLACTRIAEFVQTL